MTRLIVVLLLACLPFAAYGVQVDYVYSGQSVIEQVVTAVSQAEMMYQVVNAPPIGDIEEVGTLFMLNQAPWGLYESHAPVQLSGTYRVALEGTGTSFDNSAITVPINDEMVARIVPFVVIGGQRYFFNNDLIIATLNGINLTKTDGQNYDLSLAGVVETFILEALVSGLGDIFVSPAATSYQMGQEVTLSYRAAEGWTFDQWIIPTGVQFVDQPDGSIVVTIGGNTKIIAKFISPTPIDPDVNHDGRVDATDVQLVINAALSGIY